LFTVSWFGLILDTFNDRENALAFMKNLTGVRSVVQKWVVLQYVIEKSVCDAVRFRNKVGIDIASEVLGNYLKLSDRNLDLLIKYSGKMRIENRLMQYLEVLI
jgi:hypothetical protein